MNNWWPVWWVCDACVMLVRCVYDVCDKCVKGVWCTCNACEMHVWCVWWMCYECVMHVRYVCGACVMCAIGKWLLGDEGGWFCGRIRKPVKEWGGFLVRMTWDVRGNINILLKNFFFLRGRFPTLPWATLRYSTLLYDTMILQRIQVSVLATKILSISCLSASVNRTLFYLISLFLL